MGLWQVSQAVLFLLLCNKDVGGGEEVEEAEVGYKQRGLSKSTLVVTSYRKENVQAVDVRGEFEFGLTHPGTGWKVSRAGEDVVIVAVRGGDVGE
jgi:hypothetical protein